MEITINCDSNHRIGDWCGKSFGRINLKLRLRKCQFIVCHRIAKLPGSWFVFLKKSIKQQAIIVIHSGIASFFFLIATLDKANVNESIAVMMFKQSDAKRKWKNKSYSKCSELRSFRRKLDGWELIVNTL